MKYITFAFAIILLSCSEVNSKKNNKGEKEATGKNTETKLHKYLVSFFDQNETVFNNSITLKEASIEYQKGIVKAANEGLFEQFPMTLLSIFESSFEKDIELTWVASTMSEDSSLGTSIFLKTKLPKAEARKYIEFGRYNISGKYSIDNETKTEIEKGYIDVLDKYHRGIKVTTHNLIIDIDSTVLLEDTNRVRDSLVKVANENN